MKSHVFGFYAVLLLWLLVSFLVQAQEGPITSGCLTTADTKVPLKNLVSYRLQHKPLFHVDAVRFLTISGKIICSHPSSLWAIKSMKHLDGKNKKRRSVLNKTAHQSVTAVPVNISTTKKTRLSSQI